MECSEDDIYTITGYDFDWRRVGRRLLGDQKVRDIDREGGSEGEKRENMLLQWRRTKARDATYRALVKVLRDLDNNATADRVEELEEKRIHVAQAETQGASNGNGQQQQQIHQDEDETPFSDTDIILMDKIGDGAQGTVYRALCKSLKVDVAVKVLQISKETVNATKREIETQRAVKHTNIAKLWGVYENKEKRLCLVLELAETSFDKHLKECTPNLETSLDWSMHIAEGMRYLHYGAPRAIVHGDLKSLNVLVYPGNVLKIADFGCAKFRDGKMSTVTKHTFQWCAPELFDEGKHSMESDVYAYGVVLWEIVTHEEPYKGLSEAQIMRKVDKNERLEIPSDCHEVMKSIMLQCWDKDPKKRLTFKTIVHKLESIASKDEDQKTTAIDSGRGEEESQWTEMPQPSYLGLGQKLPATVPTPVVSSTSLILSELIAQEVLQLEGVPTMPELLSEKLNVAVQIGAKYPKFGIHLLDDKTGAIVEALEIEHSNNAERINMAILRQWLQGKRVKPVTWSTLLTVIKKIGM